MAYSGQDIEKRLNKIWDGSKWVEVYNPTSADLVYMQDNSTLQSTIGTIKGEINTLDSDIDAVNVALENHGADFQLHKTAGDNSKIANLAADANATYATKAEVAGVRRNYVVNTIAQRDALVTSVPLTLDNIGDMCWVADAAADPTVGSGAALYGWAGPGAPAPAIGGWVKLAEAESLDMIFNWSDIVGRPTSSVIDIDDAVAKTHVHTNKAVIDGFDMDGTTLKHNGVRVAGSVISFNAILNPRPGDVWLEEMV